jgi:hypothetical protein
VPPVHDQQAPARSTRDQKSSAADTNTAR